jgi:phage baseplate assembly protein W
MTDLIGAGWAFPGRISAGGGIALDGGAASIEAALRMILATAPGERVMRPDFGCSLWDHVFDPLNAGTAALIEQSVRVALERWEPRIEVIEVHAVPEPDAGRMVIRIRYLLRATNDERNLVHPFYLIPEEDDV